MQFNWQLTAKRLKELRENAQLSHNKLSAAIKEKYGITISADSLKIYEVADPHHTKARKVEGMNIGFLFYLADFYGVSADWILGISNAKTRDGEKAKVVNYTGLNEDSVTILHILGSQQGDGSFPIRLVDWILPYYDEIDPDVFAGGIAALELAESTKKALPTREEHLQLMKDHFDKYDHPEDFGRIAIPARDVQLFYRERVVSLVCQICRDAFDEHMEHFVGEARKHE